jgi:hypothetical protein
VGSVNGLVEAGLKLVLVFSVEVCCFVNACCEGVSSGVGNFAARVRRNGGD